MTPCWHTPLRTDILQHELVEFLYTLIELTEFEERLPSPQIRYCTGKLPGIYGVELYWRYDANILHLTCTIPHQYHFAAIQGDRILLTGVVSGRELVQHLRNLLFWFWNEPW